MGREVVIARTQHKNPPVPPKLNMEGEEKRRSHCIYYTFIIRHIPIGLWWA